MNKFKGVPKKALDTDEFASFIHGVLVAITDGKLSRHDQVMLLKLFVLENLAQIKSGSLPVPAVPEGYHDIVKVIADAGEIGLRNISRNKKESRKFLKQLLEEEK